MHVAIKTRLSERTVSRQIKKAVRRLILTNQSITYAQIDSTKHALPSSIQRKKCPKPFPWNRALLLLLFSFQTRVLS